jgi:Sulfotransferase family
LIAADFCDAFREVLRMSPASGSREVCFDDVVHAYRWILGREPESIEILAEQASAGRNVQGLRSILLSSPEFRSKLLDIEIDRFCSRSEPSFLPETIIRLVFIHIPRCGGTSLHHILGEAVGADRVCPERHNCFWLCLAGDLARARLFSGHYDRNCVALIPGREVKLVTMLRDPRRRLLSLYDYLRAHRPAVIKADNLALAEAARKYPLGDFLDAAMEINPAAVDNTYLRAFGGRLPFHRWEQAAEPSAPKTLADHGYSAAELYDRAAEFLRNMAVVGILEQFEDSARAISRAFGLAEPKIFIPPKSLQDVANDHAHFEPVQAYEVSRADEMRISELTKYDMDLYKLGKAYLAEAIESQISQPPDAQAAIVEYTKRRKARRGRKVAGVSNRHSSRV